MQHNNVSGTKIYPVNPAEVMAVVLDLIAKGQTHIAIAFAADNLPPGLRAIVSQLVVKNTDAKFVLTDAVNRISAVVESFKSKLRGSTRNVTVVPPGEIEKVRDQLASVVNQISAMPATVPSTLKQEAVSNAVAQEAIAEQAATVEKSKSDVADPLLAKSAIVAASVAPLALASEKGVEAAKTAQAEALLSATTAAALTTPATTSDGRTTPPDQKDQAAFAQYQQNYVNYRNLLSTDFNKGLVTAVPADTSKTGQASGADVKNPFDYMGKNGNYNLLNGSIREALYTVVNQAAPPRPSAKKSLLDIAVAPEPNA